MAIMTMEIPATYFWSYKNGSLYQQGEYAVARQGRTQYNWTGYIRFTPKSEDLIKLRNSRITKVSLLAQFANLGGNYKNKKVDLGGRPVTFEWSYDKYVESTVWSGNTLIQEADNWGRDFLNIFKTSAQWTVKFVSDTSKDDDDTYSSNYLGIKNIENGNTTKLIVWYELLSSELNISDGQNFYLNEDCSFDLIKNSENYREEINLTYEDDAGNTITLDDNSFFKTENKKIIFNFPISIANNILNAKSREAELVLTTFSNEEQIGDEKIYSIILNVPERFFPSPDFSNWLIYSSPQSEIEGKLINSQIISSNRFIQGLTTMTINFNFTKFTEGAFTDNAPLTSYNIKSSVIGININGTFNNNSFSASQTFSLTKSQTNVFFDITVTNSRGQSKTFTTTSPIDIQSYSRPEIIDISLSRIDQSGALDEEGTYLKWEGTIKYSPISYSSDSSIKNVPIRLDIYYGKNDISKNKININFSGNTSGSFSFVTNVIDKNNPLETDLLYEIKSWAQDSIGLWTTPEKKSTLSSTNYLIHFSKGGRAIGLGSAALNEDAITVGWPLKLNHPLEVQYGGTGVHSEDGVWNKFISPGGEIQNLTIKKSTSDSTRNKPSLSLIPLNGESASGMTSLRAGYSETTFWGDLEVWESTLDSTEKAALTLYKPLREAPELKLGYFKNNTAGWEEHKILTENDFCYHPGETALIQGMAFGLITDSARRLILEVPLYKSLKYISSITVDSFIFAMMRAGGGNLSGSIEFAEYINDILICKEKNSILLNCWKGDYFSNLKTENAVVCDFGFGIASGQNSSLEPNNSGLKLTFN